MITILEGPDCAGKSTLAKELIALGVSVQMSYTHFGPPPKRKYRQEISPAFMQYLSWFEQHAERMVFADRHFVMDRFYYGESIYGPVFRRDFSFEPWMLRMLDRLALSYQGAMIICLPPWEVVEREWIKRKGEELLHNTEQLLQVYEGYRLLATMKVPTMVEMIPNIPTFVYDWTQPAPRDELAEFVRTRRAPKNLGPGIGNFSEGAVLLVGDQVNRNVDTMGWPFVATQGSSRWLTQQLEDCGVPERNLYWVNAKDRDGLWTNPTFVDLLKPRAVISLGHNADKWVKKHRINNAWAKVDHPAFWKRFHFNERYPLLHELEVIGATV